MPKLSIITVNLNNAKGLEKTIKSVTSQINKFMNYFLQQFSEYLFWDTDRTKLDFEKSKTFIIKRSLAIRFDKRLENYSKSLRFRRNW